MKIKLSDLWRWDGTVDRGTYALIGVLGFAIKHNVDRLVATLIFDRPWGLFNYLTPPLDISGAISVQDRDVIFFATMLALALPFIWVGVVLTLRRLRAVRLPPWFVAIFFLPVVNLVFFALLSVLPSRGQTRVSESPAGGRHRAFFTRVIPDHPVGSAAMALLLTSFFAVPLTVLSASVLATYGFSLFVALPFCLGLASVLLYGYQRPRSYSSCLLVSAISTALLAFILLAIAAEGFICLIVAGPLVLGLAAIGGTIGYVIQNRPWCQREAESVLLLMVLIVPVLMGAEYANTPDAPLFAVRTLVEVDAAPEEVWRHVVSFTELPEPDEWVFRLGIAYPIHAEIEGKGVGAVRRCVFSTGNFVEPIEVWNEPWQLKFSVTQNPPPMQEWTPYKEIHPPHLDGFLVSQGGQFLLIPLAGDRTRLEGTTWYRHNMWPARYWQIWSDFFIHRIHLRVLEHIKRRAESPSR
jgi:hypothetical protein